MFESKRKDGSFSGVKKRELEAAGRSSAVENGISFWNSIHTFRVATQGQPWRKTFNHQQAI